MAAEKKIRVRFCFTKTKYREGLKFNLVCISPSFRFTIVNTYLGYPNIFPGAHILKDICILTNWILSE